MNWHPFSTTSIEQFLQNIGSQTAKILPYNVLTAINSLKVFSFLVFSGLQVLLQKMSAPPQGRFFYAPPEAGRHYPIRETLSGIGKEYRDRNLQ